MLRELGLEPQRPYIVAVLAVVLVAYGLLTALFGLLDAARVVSLSPGGTPRIGAGASADAIISIAFGAAIAVAGLGLWRMRVWAWVLGMFVCAAGFLLSLGNLLWMVVWGALLVYLWVVRGSFHPFHPFRAFARRILT